MAKKKKFYTVWVGRESGVFDSWDKCKRQIHGFEGAKYKSFELRSEAETALNHSYSDYYQYSNKKKRSTLVSPPSTVKGLTVDAACAGNPGKMEYRGVEYPSGIELFKRGVFEDGTNNVGEFLAIVHALSLTQQMENPINIYSDSRIAMDWVENRKCKTRLQQTTKNSIIFELIIRAEQWLDTHRYKNRIIKWETKKWGEIPADFGRK